MQTETQVNEQAYQQFRASIKLANGPIFTTNVENLFDTFLSNLPESVRQHYNCNCCRRFFNRYGGLVTLDANNKVVSAVLPNDAPDYFVAPLAAMLARINMATITGIFKTSQDVLGTPVTGEWSHFYVDAQHEVKVSNRTKTAHQVMADKLEDYNVLERSLQEFSVSDIETAVAILKTNALYRSQKFLDLAEWFLDLKNLMVKTKSITTQNNLIWLAVAQAPAGWCRVRSSMIGTLLDDIQLGYSFDNVKIRFEQKMGTYQIAQSAPTVGGIAQAEKMVEKLGISKSLQRRFLTIDEITNFVWRPKFANVAPSNSGVFGNITPKQKTQPQPSLTLPSQAMSWEKFARTILSSATKIEVKTNDQSRFMALVTAVNQDSPNILGWDNFVSWYYHGGVDAEMRRRVVNAGGRYDDVEMRFTLMWDSYTDLDLHVITPNGYHIYYPTRSRKDSYGGWLDVDANGLDGRTITPVENVQWINAPQGNYRAYIHNYADRNDGHNPWKAELAVGGKSYTFSGMLNYTGQTAEIVNFNYRRGVTPNISSDNIFSNPNGSSWNLDLSQWHEVTGIVNSPNQWGKTPSHSGLNQVFLLVDGCRDTNKGEGRGFFTEMLQPDLREIRKTLDAFAVNTAIEGADQASACGIGLSPNGEYNLELRVTSGNTVATYKIDRWD